MNTVSNAVREINQLRDALDTAFKAINAAQLPSHMQMWQQSVTTRIRADWATRLTSNKALTSTRSLNKEVMRLRGAVKAAADSVSVDKFPSHMQVWARGIERQLRDAIQS